MFCNLFFCIFVANQTASMPTKSTLLKRLENREKFFITSSHYLKKWNVIFYVVALTVLAVDFFIVLTLGKTFFAIGLVFIVSILPVLFVFYLRKHIKSTYMTGDTLIFKSFDKSSKVTSLRSVKSVKTKSILGFHWTRLDYKLDGMSNSVLIIDPIFSKSTTPEYILSEAIDWSKKRKANHKPGSVAV